MTDLTACTGEETAKMSTAVIESQPYDSTTNNHSSTSMVDGSDVYQEENSQGSTTVEKMEVDNSNTNISNIDEIQDENLILSKMETDVQISEKPAIMDIDKSSLTVVEQKETDLKETENGHLLEAKPTASLATNGTLPSQKLAPSANENRKIPSSEFSYKKYMDYTSSDSAEHPLLFSYHRVPLVATFNAIFIPDMSAKVINGQEKGKEGVIKCVDYPWLTIETKDLQTINVDFSDTQLVFDGFEIHFWTRYVDEETANKIVAKVAHDDNYEKPIYSFIKVIFAHKQIHSSDVHFRNLIILKLSTEKIHNLLKLLEYWKIVLAC
jgi:hypothetical protein